MGVKKSLAYGVGVQIGIGKFVMKSMVSAPVEN
jgi:hypothetical protein